MKAFSQGFYTLLRSHIAFGTLLAHGTASVYSPQAPQGEDLPFVEFRKMANTPQYTLTGEAYENAVYQVKAVDKSPSAALAETIAGEILLALEDQSTALTGYRSVMFLRRESDLPDIEELVEGQVYVHRGFLFRIWAQPN